MSEMSETDQHALLLKRISHAYVQWTHVQRDAFSAGIAALYAVEWLRTYLGPIKNASTPLWNITVGGEHVFEWWHGSRKLTVYVRLDGASDYIKVLEDGTLHDDTYQGPEQFAAHWAWLHDE